jgi:23S rRNA pseudouridine2605 synthase
VSTEASPHSTPVEGEGIRLQKVLAEAGIGSRRACEEMIDQGRVAVDGKRVRVQGMRVDPAVAVVSVDGVRINTSRDLVYLALNKPRGVVSTLQDPEGRPSLGELLAGREERIFHVGRLDAETEGLLLLTNDGELTHRLTHPSFGVQKTYLAEVPAPVARDVGKRLREGVELDDGLARVDKFRVVGSAGSRLMVEVVLHEGRNHIVRRLLEAVGNPVSRLVRTQFGPVLLGDLKAGRTRPLTRAELGSLYASVGM